MAFDIARVGAPEDTRGKILILISTYRRALIGILIIGIVFLDTYAVMVSAPHSFPDNALVTIPSGLSAQAFGEDLHEAHIIRSATLFRILARISGYDHHLETGAYVFTKPLSIFGVLARVGHGEHGIEATRLTFTEGMTRFDIADTLAQQLPGFDEPGFLISASTSEGYLFPETYLILPGTPSADIVLRLKTQFSQSIATITPQILASSRSFSDVVILASILEREANTPEDMRMVAGILWNRIARGMPLQVDATFGYIHQENGYTPTAADLSSDSAFNTYVHKGLPPTPISNPGITALLAALTPTKSSYVYYLTGKDGKMHYAKTFEEHKKNRALYLD